MFRAQRTCVLLAVGFFLSTAGCNTPDAVAKFCAASTTTLTSAAPIFEDLEGSCLREKNMEKGIGAFTTVRDDPHCDGIGQKAEGAVAAAQVLSDYFNAINSIATFGTAKTASDASSLVSKTGDAVGASSAAQIALGSIAKFLSTAALSGYQQRALAQDLPAVRDNVGAVIDALVYILQRNYLNQVLQAEDDRLTNYYKGFAQTHPGGDVTLELDDRWRTAEQAIAAKRASAQSLINGLKAIKKGMADLAANAHSLKAKQLPGLLAPYIAQLQILIPQIQKGF